MNIAVNVQGLTRTFGDFAAVDHIDPRGLARATIFGFLGPNGAGQVHDDPHALRPAPALRRERDRRRLRYHHPVRGDQDRASATCRRSSRSMTTSPSRRTSTSSAASTACRRQGSRRGRNGRWKWRGSRTGGTALTRTLPGRFQAAARPRLRDPARTVHPVPGRADLGRRPDLPPELLDLIYEMCQGRDHGLRHDPLHGRGGLLRPARAHLPRQDHRRGNAGELRQKHHDARRPRNRGGAAAVTAMEALSRRGSKRRSSAACSMRRCRTPRRTFPVIRKTAGGRRISSCAGSTRSYRRWKMCL